jgi:hypothetical protein
MALLPSTPTKVGLMSCEACEEAHDGNVCFPFRVGNKELGWGTVLIYACRPHAQLVMELLRERNPNG